MASAAISEPVVRLARVRAIVLYVALFTTLFVGAALSVLDAGLHSPHAGLGIVSYELAGADAASILGEWSEAQRRDALLLQGLDYLFIPGYSVLLAVVALSLATRLGEGAGRLRALAPIAAWAALAAGAADVVENVPLILMLRAGAAHARGAALAAACATLKFSLLLTVVLYVVATLAALCARVSRSRPYR